MTKPTTSSVLNRFSALKAVYSADAMEHGAFCHFTVPSGPNQGDPMWLDAKAKSGAVGAMVRSSESKHYRAKGFSIHTLAISATKRAKEHEQDKKIEEQMALERPRRFAALVVSFRNSGEGGEVVPSQEELLELGNDADTQWVVTQVMNFAHDQSNFGASGNAQAAPPAGEGGETEA